MFSLYLTRIQQKRKMFVINGANKVHKITKEGECTCDSSIDLEFISNYVDSGQEEEYRADNFHEASDKERILKRAELNACCRLFAVVG